MGTCNDGYGDQATALPVTVLTRDASVDALSETDYREIYDEVRGFDAVSGRYGVSLDEFVGLVGSQFSKAAWSKYHRGELELNRTMRSELRRAVGLDALPPTVVEAMDGVDPDAVVVRVGADLVRRVVLVGTEGTVSLLCNGTVSAEWGEGRGARGEEETPDRRVTGVTRDRKGVFVPAQVFERVNALRRYLGASWVEVLEAAEVQLKAALVDDMDGVDGVDGEPAPIG